MSIRVWPLPLAAGVLALFTIHVCYLIAAAHGHVPWCLPWLDSCTSISATGRQLPEKLVFKPLMMLVALLVALSLLLAVHWLRVLGDGARGTQRAIRWLGLFAATCMVVYLAALGEGGDAARLMRRVGVTLGFALTFLAELLLLQRFAVLRRTRPDIVTPGIYRALWLPVTGFLLLGVTSVVLLAVYPGYARIEDAFEWVFALLVNLALVPLALAWRRSDFRLQPQAGAGIGRN